MEKQIHAGISAFLLENGHLLRSGVDRETSFHGPGSGGHIQEFSWDGDLLWDYSFSTERQHPHHDICRMPNGNVLVVAWDKKTGKEAIAAGRRAETVQDVFLPDCILEIHPTGKTSGEIVWQWHAWDHLVQDVDKSKPNFGDVSEHPELIDINYSNDFMRDQLADPQQLAKLRSLGYVGGGPPSPNQGRPDGPPPFRGPPGAKPPGSSGPGGRGGPRIQADWMHTNGIDYNADLDQIMLSIHSFSEVWIIDHSTTTSEAASHTGGRHGKGGDLLYRWGNPKAYRNGSESDQRLFSQHNAQWIPKGLPGAGHMLVFNNGTQRPDSRYSSVDEVVLPVNSDGSYTREEYLAYGPSEALWSYSAPDKTSFFSMMISGAHRLPNGNTFVCSGDPAIVFEVTPEKEVVWQYKHPGGMEGSLEGRPGELFPQFLRGMLRLTAKQNSALDNLQEEVFAELDKVLTEEQRDRLSNPSDAGGDHPRGPRGFSLPKPGVVLQAPLVESLDLSKKQVATLAKFQKRIDGKIKKMLTKEQNAELDEMRKLADGDGGFSPFGFGPRNVGPPGGDDRVAGPGPGGPPPGGLPPRWSDGGWSGS